MQMVCIISCNNPVQAASGRLDSSNRVSDQPHSQQRGWEQAQGLENPGGLSPGPPKSLGPRQHPPALGWGRDFHQGRTWRDPKTAPGHAGWGKRGRKDSKHIPHGAKSCVSNTSRPLLSLRTGRGAGAVKGGDKNRFPSKESSLSRQSSCLPGRLTPPAWAGGGSQSWLGHGVAGRQAQR